MNNVFTLYLIITFLIIGCTSRNNEPVVCSQSKNTDSTSLYNLTKNNFEYWDAKVGYGFYINCNGGMREYKYNDSDEKQWVDYGDYKLDTFDWIWTDSIILMMDQKVMWNIVSLKNDELVIYDTLNSWGIDTFLFIRSPNRNEPIPPESLFK